MDPLSVAAGVAGLLSLAIQLAEICQKYQAESPRLQLYDFIFELNALVDVMKRLNDFLDSSSTPPTFTHLSALLSANARCKQRLEGLLKKLKKTVQETNKIKRMVDRALWPLTEKEHRENIEDIHRFTQVFSFALSIEGCDLLSKSSTEVAALLKEQAQKLEETKKLCGAMPDLVSKIEASLDQISSVRMLVQDLKLSNANELTSIYHGIQELKMATMNQEHRRGEEERTKILSWLSPVSFEAIQRQLFERHQPGTGTWLIEHETFEHWKNTRGSVLWCSGIPGAGKTFMASLVINALREAETVVFVYADYKEHYQQSSLYLISSITRQLALQNIAVMEGVVARYKAHAAGSSIDEVAPLTFAEHVDILQTSAAHVSQLFVIIDAVDEIPGPEDKDSSDIRFEFLEALSRMEHTSIFCTSRPHVDGSTYFPSFSGMAIEATEADLRTFLEARISASRRLCSFLSKDPSLRHELVQTITRKSEGMFLLARLQIEQIMTSITIRQVRSTLDALSSRLYDMYTTTMERIKDQSNVEARLGIRAISWIANVMRPLTVSEIVHALSLEGNDQALDDSSLIDIHIILEACGGLVQLQPASMQTDIYNGPFQDEETIGFVHYTMQEFMDASASTFASHCDIANTCLTYLCLKVFRNKSRAFNPNIRHDYPFLGYAAPLWPAHAVAAADELNYNLVEKLISPSGVGLTANWLQFALREQLGKFHGNIPPGFAAAVAAMHGASAVLQFMLDKGLLVNVRYHGTLTPFTIALRSGHQPCIDLLFSGGLTSNAALNRSWVGSVFKQCRDYGVLHWFHRLLENNLENIKTSDHASSKSWQERSSSNNAVPLLSSCISFGETTTVKKLLAAGWDPNLTFIAPQRHTIWGAIPTPVVWRSVLHKAIENRHPEIVRCLLAAGADVSLILPGSESPLLAAVDSKNKEIINQLLEAGAHATLPDTQLYQPLIRAVYHNDYAVVQSLLTHGAIVRDGSRQEEHPFEVALGISDVDSRILDALLVRYLEGHNSKEQLTSTIISALRHPKVKITESLLQERFKSKDDVWEMGAWDLLSAAIDRNFLNLPEALLNICAELDTEGHFLSEAARLGNFALVARLLKGGFDVNVPEGLENPLIRAFTSRNFTTVQFLLQHGAKARDLFSRIILEKALLLLALSEGSNEALDVYKTVQSCRIESPSHSMSRFFYMNPDFSSDRFMLLCRLGGSQARAMMRKAAERGIRPTHLSTLLECLDVKEELDYAYLKSIKELATEALRDENYDICGTLSWLSGPLEPFKLTDPLHEMGTDPWELEFCLRSIVLITPQIEDENDAKSDVRPPSPRSHLMTILKEYSHRQEDPSTGAAVAGLWAIPR